MFGKLKAPEWKTPPMEIFRRQMMITVEACEETDIKIALEFLPLDHVAVASDWPHYDGTPELIGGFNKVADEIGLTAEQKHLLATGTMERWFPVR